MDIEKIIAGYTEKAIENSKINPELYGKYEVKRGLRDISGKGVLAGLTNISKIVSYITRDNDVIPCEGRLLYRGICIEDIVNGFISDNRFGFEEVCFLLLFGYLPNEQEYNRIRDVLAEYTVLPSGFVRDTIMNAPSCDMMNALAKSVLTLYSYDDRADDISIPNVIRQSLQLIARFRCLRFTAIRHICTITIKSLFIHAPKEMSIAENILHMLRPDSSYTSAEAQILDLALVLHAEHGGGNNSTFTTHVVTSSGTDTYSAVAASLLRLRDPGTAGQTLKWCKCLRT